MSDAASLLVDVGATKTLVALETGGVLVQWRFLPTPTDEPDSIVDLIGVTTGQLLEMRVDNRLRNVAVAVAGTIDTDRGVIRRSTNLPLENYPLADRLARKLNVPVIIEEDANAGAIGEATFDDSLRHQIMVYVTLSTGIGMGILSSGTVFRGASGDAGELGHIIVSSNSDVVCRCGRTGCLEALASGVALARQAHDVIGSSTDTPKITARDVLAQARDGVEPYSEIVHAAASRIAQGLDTVVNLIDPSLIVLGGGLMNSDYLFDSIVNHYRALCLSANVGTPIDVVRARLTPWSTIAGLYWLTAPNDGTPGSIKLPDALADETK